jgi:hypothetical protein
MKYPLSKETEDFFLTGAGKGLITLPDNRPLDKNLLNQVLSNVHVKRACCMYNSDDNLNQELTVPVKIYYPKFTYVIDIDQFKQPKPINLAVAVTGLAIASENRAMKVNIVPSAVAGSKVVLTSGDPLNKDIPAGFIFDDNGRVFDKLGNQYYLGALKNYKDLNLKINKDICKSIDTIQMFGQYEYKRPNESTDNKKCDNFYRIYCKQLSVEGKGDPNNSREGTDEQPDECSCFSSKIIQDVGAAFQSEDLDLKCNSQNAYRSQKLLQEANCFRKSIPANLFDFGGPFKKGTITLPTSTTGYDITGQYFYVAPAILMTKLDTIIGANFQPANFYKFFYDYITLDSIPDPSDSSKTVKNFRIPVIKLGDSDYTEKIAKAILVGYSIPLRFHQLYIERLNQIKSSLPELDYSSPTKGVDKLSLEFYILQALTYLPCPDQGYLNYNIKVIRDTVFNLFIFNKDPSGKILGNLTNVFGVKYAFNRIDTKVIKEVMAILGATWEFEPGCMGNIYKKIDIFKERKDLLELFLTDPILRLMMNSGIKYDFYRYFIEEGGRKLATSDIEEIFVLFEEESGYTKSQIKKLVERLELYRKNRDTFNNIKNTIELAPLDLARFFLGLPIYTDITRTKEKYSAEYNFLLRYNLIKKDTPITDKYRYGYSKDRKELLNGIFANKTQFENILKLYIQENNPPQYEVDRLKRIISLTRDVSDDPNQYLPLLFIPLDANLPFKKDFNDIIIKPGDIPTKEIIEQTRLMRRNIVIYFYQYLLNQNNIKLDLPVIKNLIAVYSTLNDLTEQFMNDTFDYARLAANPNNIDIIKMFLSYTNWNIDQNIARIPNIKENKGTYGNSIIYQNFRNQRLYQYSDKNVINGIEQKISDLSRQRDNPNASQTEKEQFNRTISEINNFKTGITTFNSYYRKIIGKGLIKNPFITKFLNDTDFYSQYISSGFKQTWTAKEAYGYLSFTYFDTSKIRLFFDLGMFLLGWNLSDPDLIMFLIECGREWELQISDCLKSKFGEFGNKFDEAAPECNCTTIGEQSCNFRVSDQAELIRKQPGLIIEPFDPFSGLLDDIVDEVVDPMKDYMDEYVRKPLEDVVLNNVKKPIEIVINTVGDKVSGVVNIVGDKVFSNVKNLVEPLIATAITTIESKIKPPLEDIVNITRNELLSKVKDPLQGVIGTVKDKLVEEIGSKAGGITNHITSKVGDLKDTIQGPIKTAIEGTVGQIKGPILNEFGKLTTTIKEPIISQLGTITDEIGNIGDDIISELGKAIDPLEKEIGKVASTVTKELNGPLNGITKGLGDIPNLVAGQVKGVVDSAVGPITGQVSNIVTGAVGPLTNQISGLAGTLGSTIQSSVGGVIEPVVNGVVSKLGAPLETIIGVITTTLTETMGQILPKVIELLKPVLEQISKQVEGNFGAFMVKLQPILEGIFRELLTPILNGILPIVQKAFENLTGILTPIITQLWNETIVPIFKNLDLAGLLTQILAAASTALEPIALFIWNLIQKVFTDYILPNATIIINKGISFIKKHVVDYYNNNKEEIHGFIKKTFCVIFRFILGFIYPEVTNLDCQEVYQFAMRKIKLTGLIIIGLIFLMLVASNLVADLILWIFTIPFKTIFGGKASIGSSKLTLKSFDF